MKAACMGCSDRRRAEALDGGDLRALVHHRQAQAGHDPPPIHQHRAGAALALVAALLGAGQVHVLAQRVQQVVRVSTSSVRDAPFTVSVTRASTGVSGADGPAPEASAAAAGTAVAAADEAPAISRSRREMGSK
jgi:hypothetical protein